MHRALVVVDMIEDFVHEGGALYCGPSMAKVVLVIERELERARSAGEPVVYLTDEHLPDDAEFLQFPPHAIRGTDGARIVPELAARAGDVVIPKRRFSGFFGTDLDLTLRERGVDTLRLVGDCTNICVLYTAADARNLGYGVEVVRDGVTSFDLEAHASALRELEATLGATILT
ncbi:MAG TPA: isochorismatase family cysteine hydrolase [Candidatus Limnocylindria bacterium]|nr:isochorismatase family cysteine hydrolase [Candidatus Limnocylindria bacterium]